METGRGEGPKATLEVVELAIGSQLFAYGLGAAVRGENQSLVAAFKTRADAELFVWVRTLQEQYYAAGKPAESGGEELDDGAEPGPDPDQQV